MRAIGKAEDAAKVLRDLVSRSLADAGRVTDAVDYFAKFGEKRAERVRQAQALGLAGLGYLGQGKTTEANAQFVKALELDPSNLVALTWKDHHSIQ